MAVTRTQQDLAVAVMEDLGLLSPGELPSARDKASIVRRYENLLEELRDERLVYWDANEIPMEAFEALANIVGTLVMKSFGFPAPTGEEMDNALEGCKRRIRKRVVKPKSGESTNDWDTYF